MHRPKLLGPTDPRALRSRDALRKAFLKLLKRKSFEQITISEIAETAGVGRTTFFRHHATKESILEDVAQDESARLFSMVSPLFDTSDLREACLALCTYVEDHRALWTTLLTGGAAGAMRNQFILQARRLAPSRAPPDSWLPQDIGGRVSVSSTIELLTCWLEMPEPLPADQIAEILDRLIMSPLPKPVVDRQLRKTSKPPRSTRTKES